MLQVRWKVWFARNVAGLAMVVFSTWVAMGSRIAFASSDQLQAGIAKYEQADLDGAPEILQKVAGRSGPESVARGFQGFEVGVGRSGADAAATIIGGRWAF